MCRAAVIAGLEANLRAGREQRLAIAGLVNAYHNDATTLTAAQTLRAIADVLGDPFQHEQAS